MKRASFTAILLTWVWVVAGCAGAQKEEIKWVKGPMPQDGNFDGVYQSDFGRLELTASGNDISGLYESDNYYGRIEGQIKENLLFFNWTQWNQEMRGKTRKTQGEGVFQYVIEEVPIGTSGKTKLYHKLEGWWGYDDAKISNRWNAAKLSNRAKKRLKPQDAEAAGMDEGGYEASVGFDSSGESSGGGGEEEPEEEEEESGSLDDVF